MSANGRKSRASRRTHAAPATISEQIDIAERRPAGGPSERDCAGLNNIKAGGPEQLGTGLMQFCGVGGENETEV